MHILIDFVLKASLCQSATVARRKNTKPKLGVTKTRTFIGYVLQHTTHAKNFTQHLSNTSLNNLSSKLSYCPDIY